MIEMLTIVFVFCQMEMIKKKKVEIKDMFNNYSSFEKKLDELFLPYDDNKILSSPAVI